MNENKKDLTWLGPTIGAAGGLLVTIISFFTPLIQTMILKWYEKAQQKREARKAKKAQKVKVETVKSKKVKN